ncbi:hypothetical protein [Rhizobium wuzhouense]|uniref:Uncharacterized protein n=1 Tax=Rhizobium wuzhouense TaxID=1986026 RepID=A0ABX5NMD2_9HYPH|nr:hypothetical protein [Rhizobium wuzhouense]PYB71261.1 hypothetical protein DMY87_18020 [Rhizobium wuzhouense]
MNTNFLHNIINVLIILIVGLHDVDWTAFFSAETSLKIVAGLTIAKLLINGVRDGLTGMVKPQPPVER